MRRLSSRSRAGSRTRRVTDDAEGDDDISEVLRLSKETAENEEASRVAFDIALVQSAAAAAAAAVAAAGVPPKKKGRSTTITNLDAFIHPLIQRKVRIAHTIPDNPQIAELRPEGLAAYRAAMIDYWLQPNVVLDTQSRLDLVQFFFPERASALEQLPVTSFKFPIPMFQFHQGLATHILHNQLQNPPLINISGALLAGAFEIYANFTNDEERTDLLLMVHLLMSQLFIACHLRGNNAHRRYPQVSRVLQATNTLLQ